MGTIAAKYDWAAIKAEYISSSISTRDLAAKYGIPYATLRDRAKREHWSAEREKAQSKLVAKTVQKTTSRIASHVARELEKEYAIADKLSDVLARAVEDPRQFNRHLVITKIKTDVIDSQTVTEKQFEKLDMKAVSEAVKSLQGVEDIKRRIGGILTETERQRLNMDRQRLELERKQVEKAQAGENAVFKIVDPFADGGVADDNG